MVGKGGKLKENSNRKDVYIYSPSGTVFRSKPTCLSYIEAKKLPLKIEDFTFTLKKQCQTPEESMNASNCMKDDNPDIMDFSVKVDLDDCAQQTEEVITNNELDLSQSLLELSESCFQLKYEKEKTEKSLQNLEKEAQDTINNLQHEIKIRDKENNCLREQIKKNEEELMSLKNSVSLNIEVKSKRDLFGKSCEKCNLLSLENSTLRNKITRLMKENLQLMETILPYPFPNEQLLKETNQLRDTINRLENEIKSNYKSCEEIVAVLSTDMETLTSENHTLRNENLLLKRLNEEISDENVAFDNQCSVPIVSLSNCITHVVNPSSKNLSPVKKAPFGKQLKGRNNKILILADSHGRHLESNLSKIWQEHGHDISCIFKPNATMEQVVKDVKGLTKSFSKSDTLVVLGGSNNDIGQAEKSYCKTIEKLLKETVNTNIIVSALPYQHHVFGLNNRICYLNMDIEKLVTQHKHASFLAINKLPRHFYTHHGLHFNREGKRTIAFMIREMICPKSEPIIKPNSKWASIRTNIKKNCINVIEADMRKVIDSYKNDPSTAFAHTISRDLNHERNMTAGVAVVFRNKFGRPQESDFINTKLTCQSVPNGATVYSLITKDGYCGKPTKDDYDEAFNQLIEDLREKKFEIVICSPMGCVHDLIQLEHFSKNINKLHNMTNATICVITYHQPSAKRKLWRGLNHTEFLEQLQKAVENYKTKDNSASPVNSSSLPVAQELPIESALQPAGTDLHTNVTTSTSTYSLLQSPIAAGSSPLLVPGLLEYSEVVKCAVKKQSNVNVSQCLANKSQATSVNNCSMNQTDYHHPLALIPTNSTQTPGGYPLNSLILPKTPPR